MFLEVAEGAGEGRKSNEADPVGGRISVPERFLSLSKDLSKDLSKGRKGQRGTKMALGVPGSRKRPLSGTKPPHFVPGSISNAVPERFLSLSKDLSKKGWLGK